MKSCCSLFAVIVWATLGVFSTATAQTVPPPPNDNFASRMVLTGQAVSSTPVAIDSATREGLEPSFTENQTVWYSWTAPQDGTVTLTAAGTTYNCRVSVFNGGDLASLILIGTVDEPNVNGNSLSFYVKAGFVYQICIGSYDDDVQGTAVLDINNKATSITAPSVVAVPAASNDNFAQAVALTGATVSAFTYPYETTREPQEPSYTGTQTVWWTWTAPADAEVTMNTAGSSLDAQDLHSDLNVFDGNSLSNLTLVAGDGGALATVSFPTKAGHVYSICVGSESYVDGGPAGIVTSVLNITTAAFPITSPVSVQSIAAANDNFTNAQDLGNLTAVTGYGFNYDATRETLEPSETDDNTLWWTWTAPQDGTLTCSTAGTDFDCVLYPFSGGSLDALTIPSNTTNAFAGGPGNPQIEKVAVSAGTTYHFAIGSTDGTEGTAVLNLAFTPSSVQVSVAASPTLLEAGSGKVTAFTLTLASPATADVVVAYTLKGTATPGADYVSTKGTVKIKAGKTSKALKLTLTGDLGGASKKTLKLTLEPGSGYTVGTPNTAKAKIVGF